MNNKKIILMGIFLLLSNYTYAQSDSSRVIYNNSNISKINQIKMVPSDENNNSNQAAIVLQQNINSLRTDTNNQLAHLQNQINNLGNQSSNLEREIHYLKAKPVNRLTDMAECQGSIVPCNTGFGVGCWAQNGRRVTFSSTSGTSSSGTTARHISNIGSGYKRESNLVCIGGTWITTSSETVETDTSGSGN